MNESTASHDCCKGAFLPLLLLSISFALILAFQVSALHQQGLMLHQILKQNEKGVEQSLQVQASLQKLVMDLVAVSADDKDAQAIIAKYGIQVAAPAAPAASPAAK